MTDDENIEANPPADGHVAAARAFDDPDEETSPEVRQHLQGRRLSDPLAVVCSAVPELRTDYCDLLAQNGWETVDVKTVEELIEVGRAISPEIVLVDNTLQRAVTESIPSVVSDERVGSPRRVIAILDNASTADLAEVMAHGYDDFILDRDNEVEILARTTSNLRDCRSLAEIQNQKRDAATLLELSQTLASSLDMQLILHMVSRLIAKVLQVERCSIIILDPEHDDAVMVAASEDRKVRDIRIQLQHYPELQRCVSNGAPVIIEDARTDPLFDAFRGPNSPIDNVRLMALFPIVFEERVTGVLFLRSHHVTRRLSAHELQFGQTVASACAVAIRNARLFDSFRDQTERMNFMRLAAEKQMEALRKYEDFFEYAADGMAIVDVDGTLLYVNREGRRLLSNATDPLRGLSFVDFLGEDSRERWSHIVEEVRHGRFKNEADFIVQPPNSEERIFSVSAAGAGQETGLIILSYRDVTETREMEIELRTTKDFLENLIDNSVDAIIAADMSGNLMLFNKGAEKIYGYTADEVIGRIHVSELYPPRVAMEVMRQLRDDRWGGAGRLQAQRKLISNKAGDQLPVSMTASIIYEDGEEVATVGVFTDLRDRLKIEAELSNAQEELIRSEQARVAAELAGMAAHELNQPLTSVLGYAEMLQHKIPENQTRIRRHVSTIYAQAERMAEIVRRIGRITKYETTAYSGNTRILSLEGSSAPEEHDGRGIVQHEETTGRNRRAPRGPAAADAHVHLDAPNVEDTTRLRRSDVQAALRAARPAKKKRSRRSDAQVAGIVRLDSIDASPVQRRHRTGGEEDEETNPGIQMKAAEFEEDEVTNPARRRYTGPNERTNPGVRISDIKRENKRDKKRGDD